MTGEALAPFRIAQPARPDGDPPPFPYLRNAADPRAGAIGVMRRLLEDGDEILPSGRAEAKGHVPIGFGACRAVILPAPAIG